MRTTGSRLTMGLGLTAVAGLVALCSYAGCAKPQQQGGAAQILREAAPVATASLTDKGMEVVWHLQLILDPRTTLTRTWLRGDYLVCLGSNNRMYVLNASNGVLLWSESVAAPYESVYPPTVYKEGQTDLMCVATTTRLLVYRASDGRLVDSMALGFAPSGGVAASGIYCYVPSSNGWIHAVALVPKTMSWGRWTERAMTAAPVLDQDSVFFASQDGTVYASAQNARQIAWQFQTEGPIVADLKRSRSGLILAASLDYSLYAIAGSSGRLAWRFDSGEPIDTAACTNGNQVFVFTEGGVLNVLDEATGQVQWRLPGATGFLGTDPDNVYVYNPTEFIGAARADGSVRFKVPLRSSSLATRNETDSGLLYLTTPQGLVETVASKSRPEIPKPAPDKEKPAPLATKPEKPATPETEKPATPEAEKPAVEQPTPPPTPATPPPAKPVTPKPVTPKTPPPAKEKPAFPPKTKPTPPPKKGKAGA